MQKTRAFILQIMSIIMPIRDVSFRRLVRASFSGLCGALLVLMLSSFMFASMQIASAAEGSIQSGAASPADAAAGSTASSSQQVSQILLSPTASLARAMDAVYKGVNNTYTVYMIALFLFFVLFYAIYHSALKRVPVFTVGNKSGDALSRQGKIVALAFSGLSVLAIFWFQRGYKSQTQVLLDTLSPFGVLAGLVTAAVVYMIIFFGFRNEAGGKAWELSLAAAGLAMVAMGAWLTYPNIWWIGWAILLIAGLLFFFSNLGAKPETLSSRVPPSQLGQTGQPPPTTTAAPTTPATHGPNEQRNQPQPSVPSVGPQPAPTPATVPRTAPVEGRGRIEGIVFESGRPGSRISDAEVWAESAGRSIGNIVRTDRNGNFRIELDVPQDNIIVHAIKAGYSEGIHLGAITDPNGGRPTHLISLNARNNVRNDVRIPLEPEEKLSPSPFDPSRHQPDPAMPKDKEPKVPKFPQIRPSPPPETRVFVDLSPFFCQIEDQETTRACAAFAAGSMYEFLINYQINNADESNRISKHFLWLNTKAGRGNIGTYGYASLEGIRTIGVCKNPLWPFNAGIVDRPVIGPDFARWNNAVADAPNQKIQDHFYIDFDDIVGTLLSHRPAYVAISVNVNLIAARGGVLTDVSGATWGGHGIVIVGYDSHRPYSKGRIKAGTVEAFKVRNSWGDAWGAYGYQWIERKALRHLYDGYGGDVIRVIGNPAKGMVKKAKVRIEGRVVDAQNYQHNNSTGRQIYDDKNLLYLPQLQPHLPARSGDISGIGIIAGAMWLENGTPMETKEWAAVDKYGFFKLEFEIDLAGFSSQNKLPTHDERLNTAFGAIVKVKVPDIRGNYSSQPFYHVVDLIESELGRGGLGHEDTKDAKENQENPKVSATYSATYSGRPIVFSEKHLHERNVIVPVWDKSLSPLSPRKKNEKGDNKEIEVYELHPEFKNSTKFKQWFTREDKKRTVVDAVWLTKNVMADLKLHSGGLIRVHNSENPKNHAELVALDIAWLGLPKELYEVLESGNRCFIEPEYASRILNLKEKGKVTFGKSKIRQYEGKIKVDKSR